MVARSLAVAINIALFRYLQDERVLGCHGREERVQLQVVGENALVRGGSAFKIEIAMRVHEKGFQGGNLSRN